LSESLTFVGKGQRIILVECGADEIANGFSTAFFTLSSVLEIQMVKVSQHVFKGFRIKVIRDVPDPKSSVSLSGADT
jgi:hypothetical protein